MVTFVLNITFQTSRPGPVGPGSETILGRQTFLGPPGQRCGLLDTLIVTLKGRNQRSGIVFLYLHVCISRMILKQTFQQLAFCVCHTLSKDIQYIFLGCYWKVTTTTTKLCPTAAFLGEGGGKLFQHQPWSGYEFHTLYAAILSEVLGTTSQ